MRKVGVKRFIVIALMVVAVFSGVLIYSRTISAQTPNLYWGSSGAEVSKVQTKLKNWGYYTGAVDGIFGAGTANAVKKFQAKNGLAVDGIVGPATWQALGYTVSRSDEYQPSRGISARDDVYLLARVVNGEAANELYLGKVAVAAVVLNRVESDQFPNSMAGVIYQPYAFESISNGIANAQPSQDSVKAAQDAMNGWDPTQGALFFWNPAKQVSSWIWSRPIITTIGAHVFAK
ncbi:spore cortex-lytic enzyme [Phosphitispora sp. TUW77]|uniref:spore cortex-lytic enzyme n=1 Tax=Phosphitispora sp. TUW77 TaxID=3152361 RepID=UPI003AB442D3